MKYVFGLELELGGPQGFLAFVPIDTVTAVNLSTGILMVHGWFYVVYLFSDFRLWSLMRWPFTRFIIIALGGVVPFLSFILEARIGREVRTYLDRREAESEAAPSAPATTPRRPRPTGRMPRPAPPTPWRPSSDRPARSAVDRPAHRAAPRARRRLRRAVRAADRAARARGIRLLRDRAAHDHGRGGAREEPRGHRALRRTVVGVRAGSAVARRGHPAARRADARHLLRLPGDGAAARRRGRAHRPPRVRLDRGHAPAPTTTTRCSPASPRRRRCG